jgi:hypothetical protein
MKSLWDEMGRPKPPEKITQEAYEHNDAHLRRLARTTSIDKPRMADLWTYVQDLRFSKEIQGSLLNYLLPFLFEAWRAELRATSSEYGGLVENLYPALADKQVFEKFLKPNQTAAVSRFMRGSILEEIDDQHELSFKGSLARPYRWVRAFTTYGVLRPDLEVLWREWWTLRTVGRAYAALQYISCLMYPGDGNRVFAAWTPNEGGGPPVLWELDGHLYEHCWQPTNVTFAREFLTLERVREMLTQAVSVLEGSTEYSKALLIREDFRPCEEIVKARCEELPRLLEIGTKGVVQREWSK